ncbi:MAG: class I SAM-dependent RNA methyltransferase [Ignavibacteriae bacterium]|nr:class I SAM-dependent RNA methyltransferase [Ignavibacteriota bacterium]
MKSFSEIFASAIRTANIPARTLAPDECRASRDQLCALCYAVTLDYDAELRLKNKALQEFWKTLRLPTPLEPLVVSPAGRHYRTTSKRKAFTYRGGVKLGLISPTHDGTLRPINVLHCAIEPQEHTAIYRQVQESIEKPYASRLAKALNYVIIKGNYSEQTVIFNVQDTSPEVVRAANTLSKSLTSKIPGVIGVFLYEDDSRPAYYMGSRDNKRQPNFKKLFGKAEVFHRIGSRSFLFSPLSFSQVNLSILDRLISTVGTLLRPGNEATLFDLYCGYGMFALSLAGSVRSVVGVELSGSSIESAISNAKRQRVANARFIRSDINAESIERVMKNASSSDVVILDPPRSGTAEGVIEGIAAREPARVVHLFCEIDLIASELKRWTKSGYTLTKAIPFDMFPGTATVETMALLTPSVA